MTKLAKFKYSMVSGTGCSTKMDGVIRSPEHAGVVECALDGQLSDDVDLLRAAPDMLAALKKIAGGPWPDGIDDPQKQAIWDAEIAMAAIALAEVKP